MSSNVLFLSTDKKQRFSDKQKQQILTFLYSYSAMLYSDPVTFSVLGIGTSVSLCTNCLFPPACQVSCVACVPSAGDIHFRCLYCLFWKWEICIRRGAMSHSSLAPTVRVSLHRRQIDMAALSVADTVVRNGHCGCECISFPGQIKQNTLSFLCNCILTACTGDVSIRWYE